MWGQTNKMSTFISEKERGWITLVGCSPTLYPGRKLKKKGEQNSTHLHPPSPPKETTKPQRGKVNWGKKPDKEASLQNFVLSDVPLSGRYAGHLSLQ